MRPYSRARHSINCGEGRTKQSHKDECDINIVMARYVKTGNLEHIATAMPRYGDFSEVPDLHTATNQVNEATELFMELPSEIRSRFNNNPAELLDFLADANNKPEAVKLGLVLGDPAETQAEPPSSKPPSAGAAKAEKTKSSPPSGSSTS